MGNTRLQALGKPEQSLAASTDFPDGSVLAIAEHVWRNTNGMLGRYISRLWDVGYGAYLAREYRVTHNVCYEMNLLPSILSSLALTIELCMSSLDLDTE